MVDSNNYRSGNDPIASRSIGLASVVLDAEFNVLNSCGRPGALFGIGNPCETGLAFREVVGPDVWPALHEQLLQAIDGESVEWVIDLQDSLDAGSSARSLQFNVLTTAQSDQAFRYYVTILNLSELKGSARQEDNSGYKEGYHALLDGAKESIHIIDLETCKYVEINDAGLKMLGITADQLHTVDIMAISAPVQDDGLSPQESSARRMEVLGKNGYTEGIWHIIDPVSGEPRVHEFRATMLASGTHIRVMELDITERVLAQQALEKSEQQYRSLFENAKEFIAVMDRQGMFIDVNEAAANMLGITQSEMRQLNVVEISSDRQDDGLTSQESYMRRFDMVDSNGDQRCIWRVIRQSDGCELTLEYSSAVINNRTSVQVFAQDITGRLNAENSLRRREARYRMMTENSFEAINILDPRSMRFIDGNRLNCQKFGVTYEQFLQVGLLDISANCQPGSNVPLADLVSRRVQSTMLVGWSKYEWMHRNLATGVEFLCEIRLDVIPETQPALLRMSIVDVTDRKHSELLLRRSEEYLQSTLDSIGDCVITTGTDGKITGMNPGAAALTGVSREMSMQKDLSEVFRINDTNSGRRLENPIDRILQKGKSVALTSDTLLCARDGRECAITVSGSPIRATGGELLGAALVFRDVTTELALQRRLRETEKMHAVGQMAGGVAHNTNNALAAIQAAAELLQTSRFNADENLNIILNSSKRAASFLKKILSLSRRYETEAAAVDIRDMVREVLDVIRLTSDRRTRFSMKAPKWACFVMADVSAIENALINICLNGAQAMSNGGKLAVTVKIVDSPDGITCAAASQFGKYICIVIEDEGTGIEPESLPLVFEPFYTTKATSAGTGLGLTTAYSTVLDHGGHIDVESQPGVGTTVSVILPRCVEKLSPKVCEKSPQPDANLRVLLTDDEPQLRNTGEKLLRILGCDVSCAGTGVEAVEFCRQQGGQLDIILLDLNMPQMGGVEAATEIRKFMPDVKIVVLSGYISNEAQADLKKLRVTEFIEKPFGMEDLRKHLQLAPS